MIWINGSIRRFPLTHDFGSKRVMIKKSHDNLFIKLHGGHVTQPKENGYCPWYVIGQEVLPITNHQQNRILDFEIERQMTVLSSIVLL